MFYFSQIYYISADLTDLLRRSSQPKAAEGVQYLDTTLDSDCVFLVGLVDRVDTQVWYGPGET